MVDLRHAVPVAYEERGVAEEGNEVGFEVCAIYPKQLPSKTRAAQRTGSFRPVMEYLISQSCTD